MVATISPPSAAAAAPPGGTTPLLCQDGTIAPDGDLMRCGQPTTQAEPPAAGAAFACADGNPAPDGDVTHCPPVGAPTAAWVQNRHGEWLYRDPAWPGWIYPLSKNRWIHRAAHYLTSDGHLSINHVLAFAGQSGAAPDSSLFFVANPNLRAIDPNAKLPSGTIVNVPKAWEPHLTTSGLIVNTSYPVGVGAQQPCPPSTTRWADGLCHPNAPPQTPCATGTTRWADGLCHPNAPPAAASQAARPCPPGQTKWADGTCHPLPPSAQPQVTTGWISAPSGHRWYRDARYPGYGYDQTQQQWLPENQLALAAAIASGDTVGAQQLQYAASGGAVQTMMARNAQQQAALTAGQQQGYGGGYGAQQGWVQGPQQSWRYLDPRYPGYAYDRGQGRWMRHDELQAQYGG